MDLIRPHTFFLVAASRAPILIPVTTFNTKVPNGAAFRLDYVLVKWSHAVDAEDPNIPTQVIFNLAMTDGLRYNNVPIAFSDVTTPAAGDKLRTSHGLRIEIPPNAYLTMEVRLSSYVAVVQPNVSITYLGKKSWGRR